MPSKVSEIDYVYEDDEAGTKETFHITYEYVRATKPRRHGHPDDWDDGSPSEIYDHEIIRTATGHKLDKKERALFLLEHADEINSLIEKQEECD